jgi:hypothetical protein
MTLAMSRLCKMEYLARSRDEPIMKCLSVSRVIELVLRHLNSSRCFPEIYASPGVE